MDDGRKVCKGHAAYDALARFEKSSHTTLRILVAELGWSEPFARQKMRERYAAARDKFAENGDAG
jgi:hypothetical protein